MKDKTVNAVRSRAGELGRNIRPVLVETRGLRKKIGDKVILDGIDISLPPGRFLTILGPNGAGKTTLLKILSLLSPATGGTYRLAGEDPAAAGPELRRRIGLVSHNTFLYDGLTARENLYFYGRLYNVPDLDREIKATLARVGLGLFAHDLVRTFSRGMQQRLAIARAILPGPDLLLLDEPYTGLDQQAIGVLNDVLARLKAEGRTVILITHSFENSLRLADEVLLLARGRVLFHGETAGWSAEQYRQLYLEKIGGGAEA